MSDETETNETSEVEDQRAEYVHPGGRDFRVEGNDVRDYLGVDPSHKSYANEYDRPLLTDQERFEFTNQYDHLEGNVDREAEAANAEAGESEGGEDDEAAKQGDSQLPPPVA